MEPLRYFKDDLGWNPVLMGAVYLACCVALGWAAVRWVDVPMRRKIGAMLRERARRAPTLKERALPN
jgi:peptidoglycan/LPS O-acetylase OafA/YrhL